jgi:hypothetical protein
MPESKSPGTSGVKWSDIVSVSFWAIVMLVLISLIPLLTIAAGVLTLTEGLIFWGVALIVLGILALVGPFFAASRSKANDEKAGGHPG